MAVLAARTASVGDQSGADWGCPAARCAHRADITHDLAKREKQKLERYVVC